MGISHGLSIQAFNSVVEKQSRAKQVRTSRAHHMNARGRGTTARGVRRTFASTIGRGRQGHIFRLPRTTDTPFGTRTVAWIWFKCILTAHFTDSIRRGRRRAYFLLTRGANRGRLTRLLSSLILVRATGRKRRVSRCHTWNITGTEAILYLGRQVLQVLSVVSVGC
jgi:hypothetical protein